MMLSNQAKIESLLFVSGKEGITSKELSKLTNLSKPDLIEELNNLIHKYNNDVNTSLQIIQADDCYKIVTKREFSDLIKQYLSSQSVTELSGATLEVLAIIAYKQPITRIEVDEIRGVKSSSIFQKLQLLKLIKEHGRKDAPGHPILYKTTTKFLDYFGISSLDELPEIEENNQSNDDFMMLFNQTTIDLNEEE
ncbi:segregation and condensation protein ScpB [Ligilactobacillus hayakitensis DSM 18933 = JCM 14209]|uniref:Segregation and condensation protein B n=2 Tax=Ligilactobacillus TaxID=2767887 RepID=A0A0R1WM39_9LACO|nr:segregation and condensation protein ScpB [Ligilactobacillus hayakitensis DSM 18933 = JCM 14209]